MRKFLILILLSLLPLAMEGKAAADTTYAELDAKLQTYLSAISGSSVAEQCAEVDFLVESCTDSLIRQHVALKIYGHYVSSPIMGVEAVAIHMTDKWFVPGIVKMANDIDLMNARIFADFNRSSLVGMQAPQLRMCDPEGTWSDLPLKGRYRLVYFYDIECSRCRAATSRITEMLSGGLYDVDLYAVYAGDNVAEWKAYLSKFDGVDRVSHFYDPTLDSGFQVKYGILQTPKLFLVGPDGAILGRDLDPDSAVLLLDSVFGILHYGSDGSRKLYDGIFDELKDSMCPEIVEDFARHIARRTLDRGDTLSFRQMVGDYLYYVNSRTEHAFRRGLEYVADSLILSRPDVWHTADDSLKVVGLARTAREMLSISEPGAKLPSFRLRGEYVTMRGSRLRRIRLSRLPSGTFLVFASDGCSSCKALKQRISAMVAAAVELEMEEDDLKFFIVDVDGLSEKEADLVLPSFDLSALPYATIVGPGGTVADTYVDL